MDMIDRKLLNLIQAPFPMVEQPYLDLATQLETTEDDVLARLTELKRQNILRQISAIFDTRRLGYRTTLVAMAYEPEKLHRAAMEINRHPGVSHNYAREGSYYNLWFTLAVPPEHDLEATANHMGRKTGAVESRIMPTIRFFKIGVNFDMVNQQGSSYNFSPDGFNPAAGASKGSNKDEADSWNKPQPVTDWEKDAIRGMQEDLPLVSRPFDPIAERLGISHERIVRAGRGFSRTPHHAPVQRSVASPPLGVPLQRNDRVAGATGTIRGGGPDHGGPQGGDSLLRAAHIPGLALHPLHHGACHHPGGVRAVQPGDRRGDRHHRAAGPVQHARVQEDQGALLRTGLR